MDIEKLNIGLSYQLYILFFCKNQYLLPFYLFLTAVLIIISLLDFPVLLTDMVFSVSNVYLFVIYFSDNDKSFVLFRNIFNISGFHRLFVKISLIYLLLGMQIIVLLFSGTAMPAEFVPLYAIYITSLLCMILFMREVKFTWQKIIVFLFLGVILFFLYAGILNLRESLIFSFSLFVVTILYSVIKLNNEASHYF